MDRVPSADLGGSSDYCVESGTGLKRSRFPCKQHLDMGKSVLTPEVNLLGKATGAARSRVCSRPLASGEREFGQHSETSLWGTEALKQLTTAGPRAH